MKKTIYQIGSFIFSEMKNTFALFIKIFLKTAIITTILFFILLEILVRINAGASQPSPSPVLDFVIETLVILGFAFVYSLPVAIAAGGIKVLWKLCGIWSFVPLILIPASLVLVFWLSSDWLYSAALNVILEIERSAQRHGMESTATALGGGGVHAGPIAVIFLVILIPYLLKDAFYILTDAAVLAQFSWFLLRLIIVLIIGIVPATVISGLGLAAAFIKRLVLRFSEFKNRTTMPDESIQTQQET
jgi:hypothetical protein